MSRIIINTDASKTEKKDDSVDQPDGYTTYVPVIVDKSPESKLNTLNQRRFLISPVIKIVQFQFKIRNMLNLPPEQCLFLYTDNYKVWEPSTTLGELHEHFGKKYIKLKYTDENLYASDVQKNIDRRLLPPLPL